MEQSGLAISMKINNLLVLLNVLDGGGIYGHLLHYSLVFAMIGSALMVFLYLWKKGRLDLDEEPKHQMFKGEEEGQNDGQ